MLSCHNLSTQPFSVRLAPVLLILVGGPTWLSSVAQESTPRLPLPAKSKVELASSTSGGGPATLPAPIPAAAPALPAGVVASAPKLVTTTVRVNAAADATETYEGYERRISMQEIEQSAGTFGDPARFMQLLPGVVSDNDQRNDFIVRGGNPAETAFVVDNIEMPSINQLALSDTTGGFVSMIDNAAVQNTILHTDAYDSKFDQRMSAVVEISTRPTVPVDSHVGTEFGIGGTGGSISRPLKPGGRDEGSGSMFISVHRNEH